MPSLLHTEIALADRLRAGWRTVLRAARLAIGVPDYETYVAHCKTRHPDKPVMSYVEFFKSRQDARYKRGSSRCC